MSPGAARLVTPAAAFLALVPTGLVLLAPGRSGPASLAVLGVTAAVAPLGGWIGRRAALVWGLAAAGAASWLAGSQPFAAALLTAAVLAGVGGGLVAPAVLAGAAGGLSPARRGAVTGRVCAAMTAGLVGGGVLAAIPGPLPAQIAAAACAALLLLVPRLSPASPGPVAPAVPFPFLAAAAGGALVHGVLERTFTSLVTESLGSPGGKAQIAVVIAAGVSVAAQALLLGRWVARYGEELILLAVLLVTAAGLFVVASAAGLGGVVLGLTAAGAALLARPAAACALLRDGAPPATLGLQVGIESAARLTGFAAAGAAFEVRPTLPYYGGALLVSLVYVGLAMAWRREPAGA